MDISQLNAQERTRATLASAAARRGTAAYATTPSPSVTRQPDSVNISAAARSMAAALKGVSSAPEIREERIAAIKAAVASGTYSVDSRALARAIVEGHGPDTSVAAS
jgi:negative regulator of flagellin synthesis FlgM